MKRIVQSGWAGLLLLFVGLMVWNGAASAAYLDRSQADVHVLDTSQFGANEYVDFGVPLADARIGYTISEYDGSWSLIGARLRVVDTSGAEQWIADLSAVMGSRLGDVSTLNLYGHSNGNVIVTWEGSDTGCGNQFQFAIYDSNGSVVKGATDISENSAATYNCYTGFTELSNGNFVFFYQDTGSSYRMRIFDATGNPVTASQSISNTGNRNSTCGSTYSHSVAANDSGTFMFVYNCYESDTYYGVIYNNDGTQRTVNGYNHFPISSVYRSGSAQNQVGALSDNRYIVLFKGEPGADYTSRDERYAIFDDQGNKQTEVVRKTIGNTSTGTLLALKDGGFIITTINGSSQLTGDLYGNDETLLESGAVLDPDEWVWYSSLLPGVEQGFLAYNGDPNFRFSAFNMGASTPVVTYTVATSAQPTAGGSVDGAGSYDEGSTVSLEASPATGYSFVNWTEDGAPVSTSASYGFSATSDRTLVANFSLNSYTVGVSAETGGSATGGGDYDHGTQVTLNATADPGYTFTGWVEDGTTLSTDTEFSFTATSDRNLTAAFDLNSYQIGVASSGGGSVSGGGTVDHGDTVTVQAQSDTGYSFVQWTEGGSQVSTEADYTFTAEGDRDLTAHFTLNNYDVTVSAGTGGSASGGGNFDHGQTATVTAQAETGYTFQHWTDGGSVVSKDASYAFTVEGGRALTAHFTLNNYDVTVSAGTGGTASGGGNFDHGQTATVTAQAETGYTFQHWTEGGSVVSTDASYAFTVEGGRALTAHFTLNNYDVTVSAGTGGTVSGGGSFDHGQTATVTAQAETGYTFQHWTEGGSVVSTDASYAFTVEGGRALTAHFTLNNYDVTVSAGTGGTVSGGGQFDHGTQVSVSAVPGTGYEFVAWEEDGTDVSVDQTYAFIAEGNRSLRARFRLTRHTISLSAGNGGQVSGGGEFDFGTNVTVTASPDEGYSFQAWSEGGAQVSGSAQYSFMVQDDRSLAASFTLNTYTVSASAGEGGDLSPDSQVVDHGDTAGFTITPEQGYQLQSISGCGGSANGATYTTGAVTGDCTVNAVFNMTPPVFQPVTPDRVEIDAVGLFTELPDDLAPTATDWQGAPLEVTLENELDMLRPGAYTLTWKAVDDRGVEATVDQSLYVWPMVSLGRDRVLAFENGSSGDLQVLLNGLAPEYPFTVQYQVSGDATAGVDHDLQSGSVTFQEDEVQRSVPINVLRTQMAEDGDRLIAVELVDDVHLGDRRRMQARLIAANVAPTVRLGAVQDGELRSLVARDGGEIRIQAYISDPNPGDSHDVQWVAPPRSSWYLDNGGQVLVLDPASLGRGVAQVNAIVTDSGQPALSTDVDLSLSVARSLPTLPGGASSIDESGLPGHDDYRPEARNTLPEVGGDLGRNMIEADPGLQLSLGAHAALEGRFQATLGPDALAEMEQDPVENVGGYFDFVAGGIPEQGQSINVVIPQGAVVPEHAVYRKYNPHNGTWHTFVENAGNQVLSAPGRDGYCPPPGSDLYQPGLHQGDWCVQLTIQDGGPNDADGKANGVVVDPGGVGTLAAVSGSGSSNGGGGSVGPWMLSLMALLLLFRFRRTQRLLLLAAAMVLPLSATASGPWYLGAGVGPVNGDVESDQVTRRIADRGENAQAHVSGAERPGWRVFTGYRFTSSMSAELGYIDLGKVSTEFDALVADPDDFLHAAVRVQPAGGSGVDLTVVGRYPLGEGVSVIGRLGVLRWENTYRANSQGQSERRRVSGTDPVFGLGVEFAGDGAASGMSARLEAVRYEVDGEDLDMIGLSVIYRFAAVD